MDPYWGASSPFHKGQRLVIIPQPSNQLLGPALMDSASASTQVTRRGNVSPRFALHLSLLSQV